MKPDYRQTIYACFAGYVVQAIVNNFAPLLFLTFQRTYRLPLSQITLLVTVNFGVQLLVDLAAVGFVDRIGYRLSMVLAHALSAAGLALLAVLPDALPSHFSGLLLAVILYAVGGGLLEVLVSPITEACPTENKEKAMSLLHSFYCWGHVGVVLLSTLFFRLFGIENWRVLALLWSLLPLGNLICFLRVPIPALIRDGETGLPLRELLRMKTFWLLFLMMLCAGASEQAVSQWASTFAEEALGVVKTVGDLAGPMSFAALMGLSRAIFGKFGGRLRLDRFMIGSCLLCIAAYLCVSLTASPVLGLIGCGICGFSVGIMWPGSFSKAAAAIRRGGTAMFALLALAGDLGCAGGPTLVGCVSASFQGNLKAGILSAVVFPLLLLAAILALPGARGKTRCGR